jgi:hypothetical protein
MIPWLLQIFGAETPEFIILHFIFNKAQSTVRDWNTTHIDKACKSAQLIDGKCGLKVPIFKNLTYCQV